MVVELDAITVRFVFRLQRKRGGRIGLKGIVQEQDRLSAQPARQLGIPEPPNDLADSAKGEELIEQGHAEGDRGWFKGV